MSFIFGKKADLSSDVKASDAEPRMTQEPKPMTKISLPFSKYLGEEAYKALLQDVGVESEETLFQPQDTHLYDELPVMPPLFGDDSRWMPRVDDPEPQEAAAEPVIEDLPPDVVVPEPAPEPVQPAPEPAPPAPEPIPVPPPAPQPEGDGVAKILDQMTNMIEQMNNAVMSRVDSLEAAVQNRSKEIRESFYKSHLDVIDVGRKLKQAMHEAELADLEIQKKTLEILDATEDKSIERASRIKSLGIFG